MKYVEKIAKEILAFIPVPTEKKIMIYDNSMDNAVYLVDNIEQYLSGTSIEAIGFQPAFSWAGRSIKKFSDLNGKKVHYNVGVDHDVEATLSIIKNNVLLVDYMIDEKHVRHGYLIEGSPVNILGKATFMPKWKE